MYTIFLQQIIVSHGEIWLIVSQYIYFYKHDYTYVSPMNYTYEGYDLTLLTEQN